MISRSVQEKHPLPWSVRYARKCKEWHERSSPYVADANGVEVVKPKCYVGHPGREDLIAEQVCGLIVELSNP